MSQPCTSDSSASAAALAYGLPYGHFGSSSGTVSSGNPYSYSGENIVALATRTLRSGESIRCQER